MASRYRPCGLVLVRAATEPGEPGLAPDLDIGDPGAVRLEGWAWLGKAWACDRTREALTAASPDLAAQIERLSS